MTDGMTVTDLASVVGMTPRNIRAHQSRGLLFPPQIHGRKARYTDGHVARLELIASLQREGVTLAAIKRLLEHGEFRTHTLVASMHRTLRARGVPGDLLDELLTDVTQQATRTGAALADRIDDRELGGESDVDRDQRRADLALVAVQLLAAGFEVSCSRAATATGNSASRRPRR